MDQNYHKSQIAYFQSKLNPEIDPTCRLCLQANETFHHLMTDCEAITSPQIDIMKNQIPLPDMTWSVKGKNKFIQHPLIHSLMTYDTQYKILSPFLVHSTFTVRFPILHVAEMWKRGHNNLIQVALVFIPFRIGEIIGGNSCCRFG